MMEKVTVLRMTFRAPRRGALESVADDGTP
jgi:hypothetical protein